MNDSQIRSFLAAVKYQNFTKAAEHTYIAQSVLSKHIAALERELGIPLFTREKKIIRLTEAGSIFADGIEQISVTYNATLTRLRKFKDQYTGHLFLGLLDGQRIDYRLREVLAKVRGRSETVNIQITYFSLRQLRDALIEGSIDVAITADGLLAPVSADIATKVIREGPTSLVTANTHVLSARETATFSDIREDIFIVLNPDDYPMLAALQNELCKQGGALRQQIVAPNFETLELWVETGVGVAIASQWSPMSENPALKFIPLRDVHPIREIAYWQKSNSNAYLASFIEEIDGLFPPACAPL